MTTCQNKHARFFCVCDVTDGQKSLVGTFWSWRHKTSNYVDLFAIICSIISSTVRSTDSRTVPDLYVCLSVCLSVVVVILYRESQELSARLVSSKNHLSVECALYLVSNRDVWRETSGYFFTGLRLVSSVRREKRWWC